MSVPWVVTGRVLLPAVHDVDEEAHRRETDHDCPDRGPVVQVLPRGVVRVDADASRHALQPKEIHGEREDLGANEQEPELRLADLLV